jgi:hypothetical protein
MYMRRTTKGMSLVELLIAIGLISLVFGGIMASFQVVGGLIASSKSYAGAVSLANERIEFIRALQYNDVGTIGGIPEGPLPQNSTSTINGKEYAERILVEYIDDPADGVGGADSNGILADYKRVKVEYTWDERGEAKVVSLISNIVPRGIETTAGGGTLVVNVFDADVQPLQGAEVRIFNDTGTTTIDTVRYTNASGIAMFAGAPALANYEITVTDTGYSTDQTYSATTSNPDPTTPHVAVLESLVSTMNFQIDELSSLTVATRGMPTVGQYSETLDDASGTTILNNAQISDSAVMLSGAPGSFVPSGEMRSIVYVPAGVDSWDSLVLDTSEPSNTSISVHIYDASSSTNPVLIDDADLPGNAVGFHSPTISLSLDGGEYPALMLGIELSSSDTATTSQVHGWELLYTEDTPVLANIPFTFTGSKIIGLDASAQPIPKFEGAYITDAGGESELTDLEWDSYEVIVTDASYDVAQACENIPYSLDPGVAETLTLTLTSNVAHSLRVRVEDVTGNPIPSADVILSRPGFSESAETSACGQYFFGSGITANADYVLDVSASGFESRQLTEQNIDGDSTLVIVLMNS